MTSVWTLDSEERVRPIEGSTSKSKQKRKYVYEDFTSSEYSQSDSDSECSCSDEEDISSSDSAPPPPKKTKKHRKSKQKHKAKNMKQVTDSSDDEEPITDKQIEKLDKIARVKAVNFKPKTNKSKPPTKYEKAKEMQRLCQASDKEVLNMLHGAEGQKVKKIFNWIGKIGIQKNLIPASSIPRVSTWLNLNARLQKEALLNTSKLRKALLSVFQEEYSD